MTDTRSRPEGERRAGAALLLDAAGTIREVLADDLGAGSPLAPGRRLDEVVETASVETARALVEELEASGRTFGHALVLPLEDGVVELRCHGVARGDDRLLVAEAAAGADPIERLGELHQLRLREQQEAAGVAVSCEPPAAIDPMLFEDLSRLNNELANLQRAMAKKNAQLAQINEHKNQLLGMAAHDLRDPLGVITNFGYYLKEVLGEAIDDNQRQMLELIERNSRFMVELIDDLLEIVKFESGELRLKPEPTDLAEMVRQNLALHGVLAESKRMRLQAEIEHLMPPVVVDRHKLEQVLNNLISNAIKYSPPESQITVRLRRDQSQGKAWVLLQVADQGQGIPEDERDRLFEPFQRTSAQATGGEKSTGLGLAIVKRIVEGHQGRIRVESEVGRGSTFSVELPLRSSAAADGLQQ